MAKRKLTKLEQMGIIALIVVAASFFYVRRVYEPEHERFKNLKNEWSELSEEVEELKREEGAKDAISSIREREEELEKAKSELKKARAVLADEEELAGLLTQISQLAGQYNLRIREFSPADKKELSLNRSSYRLVMTGGFLDFRDFFKEIGFLPKLVMIERVVIERESEGEGLKMALLLLI